MFKRNIYLHVCDGMIYSSNIDDFVYVPAIHFYQYGLLKSTAWRPCFSYMVLAVMVYFNTQKVVMVLFFVDTTVLRENIKKTNKLMMND